MTQPNSFYWYDYETFGIDSQRDRISQFAGVRTDEDLNVIDQPLVCYCQPSADYLPDPEACLLTGITPQIAQQKGIPEAEFIALIHQQMSQPNTCVVGYNSLRFDDEFTRNSLYRNFFDPYSREYKNGNSRWDLIDLTRITAALRPEGINWRKNEQGITRFKLTDLTEDNNIKHEGAHEALSDVYATIDLARLLNEKQPRLYQYMRDQRWKQATQSLLDVYNKPILVHCSSLLPRTQAYTSLIMPIAPHPDNKNAVIVVDLQTDPQTLLDYSAQEINDLLFTPKAERSADAPSLGLLNIQINRCPVLAPQKVMSEAQAQTLNIDIALCQQRADTLRQHPELIRKLQQVYEPNWESKDQPLPDPDLAIYSGGFFSRQDQYIFKQIRNSTPQQLVDADFNFQDPRLYEMLFRYRARNYPHSLNSDEQQRWQAFCQQRLEIDQENGRYQQYQEKIQLLRGQYSEVHQQRLLDVLQDYGQQLLDTLCQ